MPSNRDRTGESHHGFTVIRFVEWRPVRNTRLRIWRVRCACGYETNTPFHTLARGSVKCPTCTASPHVKDLTGQVFAQLRAIALDHLRDGHAYWLVQCVACKKTAVVMGQTLQNRTKCLCEQNALKHGATGTPTYRAWRAMIARCEYPKAINYANYGGRGIKVCRRWRYDFNAFLADMGEKPDGTFLDRIENDGDYEPRNCKWSTRTEQNRNTRRSQRITWNGETLHINEWSERLGWPKNVIALRLHRGWTIERIMTTPPRKW